MNRTAVRLRASWTQAAQFAALALAGGLLAAGCRSSGVTVGSGIRTTDEHGNTAFTATRITPDERNVSGQINFPGFSDLERDIDWFVFRGIAGVGYALQIHGFPADPTVRPEYDLNGDHEGDDQLSAQIVGIDGATQLVNTSGTEGGDSYDIAAAGFRDGAGRVGDGRYFWICPSTNDYFISIRHRRNGIGAYRFRLGTSQTTTMGSPENITFPDDLQFGQRFLNIVNDSGELRYAGLVVGGILAPQVEFIGSLGSTDIRDIGGYIAPITFIGDTDPQTPHIHAHYGAPNVFFPEESINLTDGDDPHMNILDIALAVTRDALSAKSQSWVTDGTLTLSDGTEARVPITWERIEASAENPGPSPALKFTVHLSEITSGVARGAEVAISPEVFRTITGFQWYWDLHPQPDMALDSLPVATSRPQGDMYNMFETTLSADAGNVVLRDGSRLSDSRGTGAFTIFYDTSLKLFQVATEIFIVDLGGSGEVGVLTPDYEPFVGDRVKVHRGGPGETGPVLFDLGTLPSVRPPRSADPPFSVFTVFEPEGFNQPIRQLTDAEAETLRNAFYTDGFYVEVTDRNTGEPLVRAEGFLDISFFPYLEPCDLPPCTGIAQTRQLPEKGTVSFALGTAASGPLDLYANGELLGALAEPVTDANPAACGLDGDDRTLSVELYPGTYYWHAHDKDGKMVDGHVTVSGGGCQVVVVDSAGA